MLVDPSHINIACLQDIEYICANMAVGTPQRVSEAFGLSLIDFNNREGNTEHGGTAQCHKPH